MPVKPLIRIIESGGWKKEENGRFGAVVVGVFETYDSDGKVKTFHFAPTLQDLPMLEELINITREVDLHNKAILGLKERAEKLEVKKGECFNE
jgi:hypothetical protein